jgi:hypothetical protein
MYRLGNVVTVIGKGCICTIVKFGKCNRLLEMCNGRVLVI